MYEKICETCGKKMFRKKRSEATRENWKYCSRRCSAIANNKSRKIKETIIVVCKNCEKETEIRDTVVDRIKIFCSVKCALLYRNKYNNPIKTLSAEKKLIHTNHLRTVNIGRKYSQSHNINLGNAISGDKHWNWQGGLTKEKYPEYWINTLKTSIRERDNYTCKLCYKKQTNRRFSVHHIDYNKNNCDPNNLITLCQSCHCKTGYNRDKWINIFQKLIGL